jgi:hypothetical protein
VPFLRQQLSKLRSNDSGAAQRRVASNAYFKRSIHVAFPLSGRQTTDG